MLYVFNILGMSSYKAIELRTKTKIIMCQFKVVELSQVLRENDSTSFLPHGFQTPTASFFKK